MYEVIWRVTVVISLLIIMFLIFACCTIVKLGPHLNHLEQFIDHMNTCFITGMIRSYDSDIDGVPIRRSLEYFLTFFVVL